MQGIEDTTTEVARWITLRWIDEREESREKEEKGEKEGKGEIIETERGIEGVMELETMMIEEQITMIEIENIDREIEENTPGIPTILKKNSEGAEDLIMIEIEKEESEIDTTRSTGQKTTTDDSIEKEKGIENTMTEDTMGVFPPHRKPRPLREEQSTTSCLPMYPPLPPTI